MYYKLEMDPPSTAQNIEALQAQLSPFPLSINESDFSILLTGAFSRYVPWPNLEVDMQLISKYFQGTTFKLLAVSESYGALFNDDFLSLNISYYLNGKTLLNQAANITITPPPAATEWRF
jgi:hypothetical protein